jgi:hypothetical protein
VGGVIVASLSQLSGTLDSNVVKVIVDLWVKSLCGIK